MSIGRKSKKKNKELVCIKPLLLAVFLIVSTAVSAWVRPYKVFADGQIDNTPPSYNAAQYIMTLLMSMGCGISNQQVVNSLYQQLGSVNIGQATSSTINTAFTNIKNAVNFDFSTMFSSTAQEAENFVQNVGADKIVDISGGSYNAVAADAGTNIVASMKNFLSQDVVFPAVGGATFISSTIAPAVLAVGAGIGLGFGIDKVRNSIVNYVKSQQALNAKETYTNYLQGGLVGSFVKDGTWYYYCCPSNVYPVDYYNNGQHKLYLCNPTSPGKNVRTVRYSGQYTTPDWLNVSAWSNTPASYWFNDAKWNPAQANGWVPVSSTDNNYLISLFSDYKPTSPDLISSSGNLQYNTPSGNDNGLPEVQPQYNPTTETFKIIPDEVIQQWIQEAVNNTQGNDQSQQSQDYQTIINNYTTTLPSENPSPEPTSIPIPTITPVTNPVPSPQPTAAPLPEPSQEEQQQLPEGMNQPDWSQKFPFCIPYDIKYFMEMWNSNREAPYFDFEISLFGIGSYHVIIDLSPFDSVASLLRMLELILFIVALALGTRKLLNPGGDG